MKFRDYIMDKMGDVERKFGDLKKNDGTKKTPWGQLELTQDKEVDTYRNIKYARDSSPTTTTLKSGVRLEIVGGGIGMGYYDMSKMDDLKDNMTFQKKTPVYTLHFDKSPNEFREFAKEIM